MRFRGVRSLVRIILGACGNTAARKLFTRVGITGHDTLFHFHDESNVWVQESSSETCCHDDLNNVIATKESSRLAHGISSDLTHIIVGWLQNLPEEDRKNEVHYRNQN